MASRRVTVTPERFLNINNKQPIEISLSGSTTIDDVTEFSATFFVPPELRPEGWKFALATSASPIELLSPAELALPLPHKDFLLRLVSFPVVVVLEEVSIETTEFINPDMKVKDVISHLEQVKCSTGQTTLKSLQEITLNHDLVLITHANIPEARANGIRLELDRTLYSYKLRPQDTLILTAPAPTDVWENIKAKNRTTDVPIVISSDEFSCKKAIYFSPNTLLVEVLREFIRKSLQPVSPWLYSLYYQTEDNTELPLQLAGQVAALPPGNPIRLKCRAKSRDPQEHFGVDPELLPKCQDLGVEVPQILAVLRDMFNVVHAAEQEGIFRMSGHESEMQDIIQHYNSGKPIVCKRANSIATLIKRWFKDLPKKLFASVPASILQDNAQLEKIRSHESLSPLYQNLSFWLFELLTDVAEKSAINRMTPNNLGIVFGPGVFGSFDSIEDTKIGSEIVSRTLQYLLDHPQVRPLRCVRQTSSLEINHAVHSPSPALLINFQHNSRVGFVLAQRYELIASQERARSESVAPPVFPVLALAPSDVKLRKHARKRSEHRVSVKPFSKRKSKRKSLPLAIENLEEVLKKQHAEQQLRMSGANQTDQPIESQFSPREPVHRRGTKSPRDRVRSILPI